MTSPLVHVLVINWNGEEHLKECFDSLLASKYENARYLLVDNASDDGSISFVGPKRRIVKCASENVYPAEVEACIAEHPAVAACAVIGVPDPHWVQRVKAIVVQREGANASEEDIVRHCRERIASYKKPTSVEFVDALPRRGNVLDYDALDRRFGGGGYPGGKSPAALLAAEMLRDPGRSGGS